MADLDLRLHNEPTALKHSLLPRTSKITHALKKLYMKVLNGAVLDTLI